MLKKLSLKGLATYMAASPSRQRKILKDYKYPSEDEARAKILYYREARDRIVGFHASTHNLDWLLSEADNLSTLALMSTGSRRTRLKNNVRGIRQYVDNFSDKKFTVLNDFS